MTFTLAKRKSNVPIVIIFPQYDITQKSIQGFPKKETNIHILHTTKSKVCKLRSIHFGSIHAVRVWPSAPQRLRRHFRTIIARGSSVAFGLTREGSCHTNICKLGSIHFGSIHAIVARGSSVTFGSLAPSAPFQDDCRTRFEWLCPSFWEDLYLFMGNRQIQGGFVPFCWEQIDCGRLALFMVRFKYYIIFPNLGSPAMINVTLCMALAGLTTPAKSGLVFDQHSSVLLCIYHHIFHHQGGKGQNM